MPAANAAEEKAAVKAPGLVAQIKVQPNKAPDCSSLKSMVDSIKAHKGHRAARQEDRVRDEEGRGVQAPVRQSG